jgi:hypothetical protein
MAITIPAGWPIKLTPNELANCPRAESLETIPSNAMPAAVWGITTGRSIMPKTSRLSGKLFRASIHAAGKEITAINRVAIIDEITVSKILLRTSASSIVSNNRGSGVFITIPTIGASINSKIRARPAVKIKVKVLLFILFDMNQVSTRKNKVLKMN